MFKPGPLSNAEAADLNRLAADVVALRNLRVAGPTMRIYRSPANIVIESTAVAPLTEVGSGSGGSQVDLGTHCFTYLADVIFGDATVACNPNGTVTVTIPVTKVFKRTCITANDLSGSDTSV